MLDIKKSYDLYIKNEANKENKGVKVLFTKEGIIQFTILQFIAHNSVVGVSSDLLKNVGIDEDYSKMILEELFKNKYIKFNNGKFYITDLGKNIIINTYFYSLENM